MSSKKTTTKKEESIKEEVKTSEPKKIEPKKANRNFFFAGKNWIKDQEVNLPEKDIEFLLSKGVIA